MIKELDYDYCGLIKELDYDYCGLIKELDYDYCGLIKELDYDLWLIKELDYDYCGLIKGIFRKTRIGLSSLYSLQGLEIRTFLPLTLLALFYVFTLCIQ